MSAPDGAWPCAKCGKSKAQHSSRYRGERYVVSCSDSAVSENYEPAEFGNVLATAITNAMLDAKARAA